MTTTKASRRYQFHWHPHQDFQLLVDGEQFFAAMLASIASAKSFVYLEMYLFESGHVGDQFIQAFESASMRGVSVYLLIDAFGSQRLLSRDRKRLLAKGVQLRFYNPLNTTRWQRNLFRDHRKLLLIDGRLAFTGGAGLVDEFDKTSFGERYWHDTMLRIEGACATDWQILFEQNWRNSTEEVLESPRQQWRIDKASNALGRVLESRSIIHSEVIRSFVKQLNKAQEYIWVASAYFVPSRKIRRLLCRRAREGVDVRLLLPGPYSDHPWARHMARRYYDRLLRHGVRVYEYQPRFMHMKILLSDQWVSMGSSNIDRWNFRWNLEANQEVRDSGFANRIRRQFESDFDHCHEITLSQWRQRPFWIRLNIWGWSLLVRMLSWASFNRKK